MEKTSERIKLKNEPYNVKKRNQHERKSFANERTTKNEEKKME